MSGLNRLEKPKLGKAGKPKRMRKPLQSVQDAPDPLADVEYTGQVEQDAAQELDAVKAGFRQRAKDEQERFKSATGGDYYCVMVFDDGDQCSAFLDAVEQGHSGSDLFVDGRAVADHLGIELPESKLKKGRKFGPDKKLSRITGIPKG